MRWVLAAALAAACGSGGASKSTTPTTKTTGKASTVPAGSVRERVKKLCGAKYTPRLDAGESAEGCELIAAGTWRNRAALRTKDDAMLALEIELVGPAEDADKMRDKALEQVGDLFDATERTSVQKALARLYQKSAANLESSGWVGDLYVQASTEIVVDRPGERWIELVVQTNRDADGERAAFADTVPADHFASGAKAVPDAWVATAKAVCTELVTNASKMAKLDVAPPKWTEGDLHVECMHPDENLVAQFVATWAPDTKKLLYFRAVADAPQKKFAGYIEKLLAPLLSPAQLTVAKTAAKKAPLDRAYDAAGMQMTSRHDTGGFYGESHELTVTVQVGFKGGAE